MDATHSRLAGEVRPGTCRGPRWPGGTPVNGRLARRGWSNLSARPRRDVAESRLPVRVLRRFRDAFDQGRKMDYATTRARTKAPARLIPETDRSAGRQYEEKHNRLGVCVLGPLSEEPRSLQADLGLIYSDLICRCNAPSIAAKTLINRSAHARSA
jgi:hypothetical protein